MRGALGDVGGRQPRDHAPAVGELDDVVDGLDRGHHVVVGDLDALGRAGGAGGVDQREHVLGRDGVPGSCAVEVRVGLLDVGKRDDVVGPRRRRRATIVSRSGRSLRASRKRSRNWLSMMATRAAGVGDHVLDLLRRVGHVDRERRRAERHHGEVGDVELGTVAEHDGDAVALAHARASAGRRPARRRGRAAEPRSALRRRPWCGWQRDRGRARPCAPAPASSSRPRRAAPSPAQRRSWLPSLSLLGARKLRCKPTAGGSPRRWSGGRCRWTAR